MKTTRQGDIRVTALTRVVGEELWGVDDWAETERQEAKENILGGM